MTIQVIAFTVPTAYGKATPKRAFNMGLTLDQFRQVHGGDWCELPPTHAPHLPEGFAAWKTRDGSILGVKPE